MSHLFFQLTIRRKFFGRQRGSVESRSEEYRDRSNKLKFKEIQNMCRKKKAEIEGFQLVLNIPTEYGKLSSIFNCTNLRLRSILDKFKKVLRNSLPKG